MYVMYVGIIMQIVSFPPNMGKNDIYSMITLLVGHAYKEKPLQNSKTSVPLLLFVICK